MIIAVNTRFLIKNRLEGIGWFTYETLKRITLNHPEHQFVFFFDRAFSDEFIFSGNITPKILFPPARHPLLWYAWFEYSVPKMLNSIKADVFLSTDGYLSLSTKLKSHLVIHDLAFENYPEHIPFITRKYYQHFSPKYARKAAQIATVSEFSKSDLQKFYNIPVDKIDVVYNGANEKFKPLNDNQKLEIKHEVTNGKDYFLYVGALHPRKNIVGLLSGFENFKKITTSDVKLVIVGRKAWGNDEMLKVYENMQFKEDVIFLGHCGGQQLQIIIGGALAIVYVSFFEGFGIPILEALKCDVPVITSNVSSMPEVAGNAALLVDPYSHTQITDAMVKIYKDPSLRKDLITKAAIQREKFSWDKTAEKYWNSIEKIF